MHSFAHEGVQIGGEGGHEGLPFPCLHLRNGPRVEDSATRDLGTELRRHADRGKHALWALERKLQERDTNGPRVEDSAPRDLGTEHRRCTDGGRREFRV